MTTIILVPTNLQGQPVGEHAHRTRFSDATVARARELRAAGWTLQAIAAEVGARHQTVHGWVSFKRRKPPARVIARRVKTSTKPVASDSKSPVQPTATSTYSDVRNSACNAPLKTGQNDQKGPQE